MPIHTTCPHCRSEFELDNDSAGTTVRCGGCQEVFDVPAATPVVPRATRVAAAVPPAKAAPRPNPRRRDDDDFEDDDGPRRTKAAGSASNGPMFFLAVGISLAVCGAIGGVAFAIRQNDRPAAGNFRPPVVVQPNQPMFPGQNFQQPKDMFPPDDPRLEDLRPKSNPFVPDEQEPRKAEPGTTEPRKVEPRKKDPGKIESAPATPLAPYLEPANPYLPGTQTSLIEMGAVFPPAGSLVAAGSKQRQEGPALKLAFSPKHDRLVLLQPNKISIFDGTTGKVQLTQSSAMAFTDLSISPDESCLYVAEFGGEVIGYSKPEKPSKVHRFDFGTKQWQTRTAPKLAFRLEAVDAKRFLLLEQDQWVDLSLNRWDAAGETITELSRTNCDYYGDMEYDPRTGTILHGNSGSSSPRITLRKIDGDKLVLGKDTGSYGSPSKGGGGGTAVLSSDGKRFYYGPLQVNPSDINTNMKKFPEPILAAGRDLACGAKATYDAKTGDKLADYGFPAATVTISRDGNTLWAVDAPGNKIVRFAIEGEKK